jgi:hypothetical protein
MDKTKFTDYLMAWSNAAMAVFAVGTAVLALVALRVSDNTQRESKKMDLCRIIKGVMSRSLTM